MPWRCSCGYSEEAKAVFLNHFRHNRNGDHKSQGWLDPATGEVRTVPPSKLPKTDAPARPGPATGAKSTTALAEAQTLTIYPKRFEMSSVLLWQAREAAIREWGWPPDISAEDFLDTFLHFAFMQRGILLGGYTVLEKRDGQNR